MCRIASREGAKVTTKSVWVTVLVGCNEYSATSILYAGGDRTAAKHVAREYLRAHGSAAVSLTDPLHSEGWGTARAVASCGDGRAEWTMEVHEWTR